MKVKAEHSKAGERLEGEAGDDGRLLISDSVFFLCVLFYFFFSPQPPSSSFNNRPSSLSSPAH